MKSHLLNFFIVSSCLLASACGTDDSTAYDLVGQNDDTTADSPGDTLSSDTELVTAEFISKPEVTSDTLLIDLEPCDCDDELECTTNLCTDDGCAFVLRPGHCLIEGFCFEDGQVNPDQPCLECITAALSTDWTPDDLNECNDQDPCTLDDRCLSGQCTAQAIDCPQDANPCTLLTCIEGKCESLNVDADCDDKDPCTTADVCLQGTCVGEVDLSCDDDNLCTDDSCVPGAGCMHASNTNPCDDQNPCTLGDSCAAGQCQPGSQTPDCDDGNPCTDDSCHPVTGCAHFPNAANCDDGDPCYEGDFCIGGACQPGPLGTACDDGNLCTDDSCQLFAGCQFEPNTVPCDDSDPCFAGDLCADGQCAAGPDALDCDDGNVCTDDSCTPFQGCLSTDNTAPCDDSSLCTVEDACSLGNCSGATVVCSDDNVCTKDICLPETGCVFEPLDTAECRPHIVIDYPPRGATINGQSQVTVTGTVTSLAGAVTSFTINDQVVPVQAGGAFSHAMPALQGMNLIVAQAQDSAGGQARTTPSFYLSTVWYPIDSANPEQSMVSDGIMIFLGPEVWDDNDTSDVDDMATIMTYYMDSLDLSSLISNPVTTGNLGWCSYKMNITNITYGQPAIDLVPISGGLHMFVSIPDFKADVLIDMSGFACPDMSGKVTADSITIDTDVFITSDGDGVTATMENTDVKVNGLNISIDGIAGFLFNWLIDFFEGTFASQLEDQFGQQLGAVIPATVVDALNSLALDEAIQIAPFLGDGDPVTLDLKTGLSSAVFTTAGGTLGLKATVVTPKVIAHNPLGSIGRAACFTEMDAEFQFPMKGSLEISLHDDFFNQLPFGMYWGGLFQAQVDAAQFGVDLAQFGLGEALFDVDFLLPPILTDCTADGQLVLQIGDLRVDGDLDLYGLPVQMTMYASLEVEAELVVVELEDGTKQLSISLGEPRIMEVEVTEVSGALAGAEAILVSLVKDNLLAGFLDSFAGGALGSFPIPEIDLSGFNPNIPPGSTIAIDLSGLLRILGYTVLSGNVKQ